MRNFLIALLAAASLVAPACGSGGDGGDSGAGGEVDSGAMGQEAQVPGAAAEASVATRKVEVVAFDDLRFEPESIEVAQGEAVTFVVVNEGSADHEFVLGNDAYQNEHEEAMQGGGHHMEDLGNALTVGPGEKAELTWKFEESGQVLFGCHEPGHYEGGMVGEIQVG